MNSKKSLFQIILQQAYCIVDSGFTWPTHLVHLNKVISIQKFFYTHLQKWFFQTKIFFFTSALEKQFSTQKRNLYASKKITNFISKKFFTLFRKKKNFQNKKSFLQLQGKKIFETKNLLYLSEKLISYTHMKKLKHFVLDMFWVLLYHCLCSQNLTGFLTNNIQSLFQASFISMVFSCFCCCHSS